MKDLPNTCLDITGPNCSGILPKGRGKNARKPATAEGERGSSIVEFALVLPLFVSLMMGIVDFGLNLNNISSVRQAVREGARRAAVGDPGETSCTLTMQIVSGPNTNEKGRNLLCSVKDAAASAGSSTRLKLVFPNGHESGEWRKR